MAFECVGLDWREYVRVDPQFIRSAEVPALCGNATKVKAELAWEPTTTLEELFAMLEELFAMMVEADLKRVRDDQR